MDFSGELLGRLLAARNMTQGEAAIFLGVKQPTINLYVNGKRKMSADRFLLFLEKFGGEVRF
ncbi:MULTISPECIES: helix-turn-helix domain-containing protein [Cyanophyceae]|nr:helix-turn-helix transcriptional regulator [Phormidium sp. FACHB-592]